MNFRIYQSEICSILNFFIQIEDASKIRERSALKTALKLLQKIDDENYKNDPHYQKGFDKFIEIEGIDLKYICTSFVSFLNNDLYVFDSMEI